MTALGRERRKEGSVRGNRWQRQLCLPLRGCLSGAARRGAHLTGLAPLARAGTIGGWLATDRTLDPPPSGPAERRAFSPLYELAFWSVKNPYSHVSLELVERLDAALRPFLASSHVPSRRACARSHA